MKHGMPSQRQLRVGEQVRHVLSDTLRRGSFHDEALIDTSALSISEVRMTPDLKQARAYVASLAKDQLEEALEALNQAAPYFQKELNRGLDTKFTPRVQFLADHAQEAVDRLEEIFHNLPKPAEDDTK